MISAPNKSGGIGHADYVTQCSGADPNLFPLRREPLATVVPSPRAVMPAAFIESAPRSGGIGHLYSVTQPPSADPKFFPLRREPLANVELTPSEYVPAALIESARKSGGIGRHRCVPQYLIADPNSFLLRREPLTIVALSTRMRVSAALIESARKSGGIGQRAGVTHAWHADPNSFPLRREPLAGVCLTSGALLPAAPMTCAKHALPTSVRVLTFGIGHNRCVTQLNTADPNSFPFRREPLATGALSPIRAMPAALIESAPRSDGIGHSELVAQSRHADPNPIPRERVLLATCLSSPIPKMPAAALSARQPADGSQPWSFKRNACARRWLMSPALIRAARDMLSPTIGMPLVGLARVTVSFRWMDANPTLSPCIGVRAASSVMSSRHHFPLATHPALPEGQGQSSTATLDPSALT